MPFSTCQILHYHVRSWRSLPEATVWNTSGERVQGGNLERVRAVFQPVAADAAADVKDKQERLKANLANLMHEYSAIRQDRQRYPFRKEHMQVLCELRKDKDIVITRPDKGSGAVLLNKADYISKTMAILGVKSKFKCVSGKLG